VGKRGLGGRGLCLKRGGGEAKVEGYDRRANFFVEFYVFSVPEKGGERL